MLALGKELDVCLGFMAVNLATAANTGARIHLRNYDSVMVVFVKGTGGAGEAPTLTLQEHTAASSGTSANLVAIDEYFKKEATTLDGTEAWERVSQTAAATVTDADWDDANQVVVAFNVQSQSLSAGYEWISVNVADVGSTAQLGALLYIPTGLKIQRRPDLLAQPNL